MELDPKRKIDDLSYKTLVRSLIHFKLSRNLVSCKSDAIDTLLAYFKAKNMLLQYECNSCGLRIPDLKRCPWCGVDLEYDEEEGKKKLLDLRRGIPGSLYRGSTRGRPANIDKNVTGERLLVRVIGLLGIPSELVKRRKTYVVLSHYHGGIFAQCYPQSRSLKIKLPYKIKGFGVPEGVVFVDLDCKHDGMYSRISIEKFEQISGAVEILKQVVQRRIREHKDKE